MQQYKGIEVNKLFAIGRIQIWNDKTIIPKKQKVQAVAEELQRFHDALGLSQEKLQQLCQKALKENNPEGAQILEGQQMILQDEEFIGKIQDRIREEQVDAAYAVYFTGLDFAAVFAEMKDDLLQARAADIQDVTQQLIRVLSHSSTEESDISTQDMQQKVIIVAEELNPSDTVMLDRRQVGALITKWGSVRSHTAILAKNMKIPALIIENLQIEDLCDGELAILDGENASLILQPDSRQIEWAEEQIKLQQKRDVAVARYKDCIAQTRSGERIRVCANIGGVLDAREAIANGCEGIGLFRSEFLYLGRKSAPSEEEQFEIYKEVLGLLGNRPVVIRTLDIGADKQVSYLGMDKEENPALGMRGIRFCLANPDLFKVQLRALMRAARYGNLQILYPMITSVEEVDAIYKMVEEVCQDLKESGIPFERPKQGVMIETPAAALISRELAKKVDFFSIGTNDLTQYTLAIDRQNAHLDSFYYPQHPAVLQLIEMVVENANYAGIWTGICGNLGEDRALTEHFVRLGVKELSVVPSAIPEIKEQICNLN